ncbi:BTAD domain-containing putative transcriptional regulator [Streptomyces sp. NPDC059063]|uniref:BTAD domain-containing putative transcriptional regulator n=1 Tax=unclassified Streptomyces TaxID=2593676 RepID=UPI0036B8AE0F
MGMRIEVLGPVRVFGADGAPVEVAGAKLRMLLARLALSVGKSVSTDALIEGIWEATSPAGTTNTLHALVHRLRRALPEPGVIESLAVGYRLALPADRVDAHRFEVLAARGRRELMAGDTERAAATLGDALALWHGAAFADVSAAPFADAAGVRLEELRSVAREDRLDAELRLGRHAEALPDLEAVCADHPLRERPAALRMRALCASGRQSDALAAYEDIRGRLAAELGVGPSAELRRTHVAVLRGEVDGTSTRTEPVPGRLPEPLTSFVGRGDELKLLAGLMDTSRLVTVVGPGGVGKTRLAVEAASRHPAYRGGRLWLVPLAGVENPQGVAGAILGVISSGTAQAMGGGPAEPLDRVAELLGGGDAVLVLDNCEHVVAEAARAAQHLLQARPQLTVLATSRESLEVMGEALCRIGPLPLPEGRAELATVAEAPAVRLFLDRATAVRPGFALDAATVDPVVDVVRRLDGLPLALELAAARLRSMTVGQIARRLDDRFRLLSTGNREAQPRQRTLRAVFEWSWDLLAERERVLARRLAYFPAAGGVDAIEAVCADERLLAPGDVVYVLGSLVDKSLVEQSGEGYRMLESIRAFAAEELARAGEREAVRGRFIAALAALAAEHEPRMRTQAQVSSLMFLEVEYDNLVFALRSALDDRDGDAVAPLLGLLYAYWAAVRYDARTESFVTAALALGAGLPAAARAAFTAIDALVGENAPTTDADKVRALITDCVDTGAMERYPMMLVTLHVAHQMGLDDLVEAEMARVRSRSADDAWPRAQMSLLEAAIAGSRGEWAAHTRTTARAAREFTEVGDRRWAAVSLIIVARSHTVRGEHDKAIAALRRGLRMIAGLGTQDEVVGLMELAIERTRAGDPHGGAHDVDAAEQVMRARGQWYMEFVVMQGRAEMYRRSGELEQAARVLDQLDEIAHREGRADRETWLAPARMSLSLTAGDAVRARELLPATVAGAQTVGDLPPVAQQLAQLRFLEGDPAGAATALGMSEALRGAFDEGDPELRELVADLTRHLGGSAYEAAYREGARLSRADAFARLDAERGPALTRTPPR